MAFLFSCKSFAVMVVHSSLLAIHFRGVDVSGREVYAISGCGASSFFLTESSDFGGCVVGQRKGTSAAL